ncbi:MAG: substrate-binding periplasmic protein, partial [Elsteraceae bacterium]
MTNNWTMPLAEFSPTGAPQDGVMLKIILAIGKASSLPWEIVTLPRQRLDDAAEAGEIDVRCYSRPEWTRSPDSYIWSDPIMTHRNLLIARQGAAQLQGIADLAGRSVAIVLGFRYMGLERYLQSATVTRHVVPTERNVALMVALGRSDYGFISALTLKYLRPR